MPQFTFQCPNCHNSVTSDDSLVGRQMQCPVCNQMITISKPGDSTNKALIIGISVAAGCGCLILLLLFAFGGCAALVAIANEM